MNHNELSLSRTSAHSATRYFMKNTWGFSYSPVNMMSIIGKLDQLQENNIANQYRARIGNLVKLYDADQRQEFTLELVSSDESAPEQGRISILSPLGAAILGLSKGEWTEVSLLGKTFHFEVLNIL